MHSVTFLTQGDLGSSPGQDVQLQIHNLPPSLPPPSPAQLIHPPSLSPESQRTCVPRTDHIYKHVRLMISHVRGPTVMISPASSRRDFSKLEDIALEADGEFTASDRSLSTPDDGRSGRYLATQLRKRKFTCGRGGSQCCSFPILQSYAGSFPDIMG